MISKREVDQRSAASLRRFDSTKRQEAIPGRGRRGAAGSGLMSSRRALDATRPPSSPGVSVQPSSRRESTRIWAILCLWESRRFAKAATNTRLSELATTNPGQGSITNWSTMTSTYSERTLRGDSPPLSAFGGSSNPQGRECSRSPGPESLELKTA